MMEIQRLIKKALVDFLESNKWSDPGPDVLKQIFTCVPNLPELELIEDFETMLQTAIQLDTAGYIDDAQFCMVRSSGELTGPGDKRLVFEDAVFVGGSVVPGEDVLLAVAYGQGDNVPHVFVFDWSKPLPSRWVEFGTLDIFINTLGKKGAVSL